MTRRRRLMLAALAVLLAIGAALAVAMRPWDEKPRDRPKLMLLTTLPLLFSENFSLAEDAAPPLLEALQDRFDVVPVSTASFDELNAGELLLMIQPPTQTAENLVSLDQWVRRGGRLVLLADPMLEWPSERPLGDPLRPPAVFMDTGLLRHWGLRIDGPERRGPAERTLAGRTVVARSPGQLAGDCRISADRLVAECAIGRGRVVVIADADVLNAPKGDPALVAIMEILSELEPQ